MIARWFENLGQLYFEAKHILGEDTSFAVSSPEVQLEEKHLETW